MAASLSEIRIERPASAVGFSDPCPCCSNKKRRCLLPSPTPRKKLLVFDDDNGNAATSPTHSSPSPEQSAPSISFSVPQISNTSTPSISPKSPASDISSFSLPSTPLLARSKIRRLLDCNSSPKPEGSTISQTSDVGSFGLRSSEPTPTPTPPGTPSPNQQSLERSKSFKVSDGGSPLIRTASPTPTSTPPMTPSSDQYLLGKSYFSPNCSYAVLQQALDCSPFTPTSTPPRTPSSSNKHLLERSNSNLNAAPLCNSKVATEGLKGEEVRIGVKCGCGILREIVIVQ